MLRGGSSRTTSGLGHQRLQASLVVSSVALAFVLLVGSGLLIRSLDRLLARDTGVRPDNVLSLRVALPQQGYRNAGSVRSFYRTLHERLGALPGVRAAAISSDRPVEPDGERRVVTLERTGDAGGAPPSMAVTWIHGDYFAAYGIPLVRGRSFTEDEQAQDRAVAIVSRDLAERFWPGEDPIGKRLKWGLRVVAPRLGRPSSAWPAMSSTARWEASPSSTSMSRTPTSRTRRSRAPISGLVRRMVVSVQTTTDANMLVQPARAAVAAIDPALAIHGVTTMAQVVSDASAPQRFSATLLTAFAVGAMALAGIGLYGILAFGVAQRTREIGVRLALGAKRGEVIGMVVSQGMRLAALGLVLGGLAALGAARLLQSLLFETESFDAWTFALVPLALAAVSLAASYLPAHRAAKVDPLTALRNE